MVLLTPIVAVLGTVAFAVVLSLTILPPFLAVFWIFNQNYLWSVFACALGFVWQRFGRRVRCLAFEGFEHESLHQDQCRRCFPGKFLVVISSFK